MHKQMCMFRLTRMMYCAKMLIFVGAICFFWQSTRHADTIESISSGPYRLGTSPALRMLLISSRKVSMTTWASEKTNAVGSSFTPAFRRHRLMSSRHSDRP